MNRLLGTLALTAFALTACGGGAGSSVPAAPGTGSDSIARTATTMSAEARKKLRLVKVSFFIKIPKIKRRKGAHYIPSTALSAKVTLNSVHSGATPPPGILTSVTTNFAGSCAAGCTVNAPPVPTGVDNMTVSVYDAAGAGGHVLSTATSNFTIHLGVANALTLTLLGVPASFSISNVPAGTAGVSNAAPFDLAVLDADGSTITGTYANPVTLTDNDVLGATGIDVNGGVYGASIQSTASTDTFDIKYSGLAIAPASIIATASGATPDTGTFSPAVTNPASICNGGGVTDQTECQTGPPLQINLYAATGTGSSASFTTAQTGWDAAPYNKTFSAVLDPSCSTIATISTADNKTFTLTVAASPAAGTCNVTVTGGGSVANNSQVIAITYSTSTIGVNARHRHKAAP
jgi:large repetitive protein